MADQPRDEGRMARWSRLKAAERAAAETGMPPAAAGEVTAAPETAPPAPPEPVDPGSLPPIDGLTETSDYSMFLRDGVPADLRRQALRKLWMTEPYWSKPDPLDMHNLDYNAVPTFPEGVKTAFDQVRGYLTEPEKQAPAPEAVPEPAAERAPAPEDDQDQVSSPPTSDLDTKSTS